MKLACLLNHIPVYTSMEYYIQWYTSVILVYTGIFAGFRAAQLDAQMEEGPEDTQPSSDPEGGDASRYPEDDEFFYALDAKSQEEAINRFMEGLEQQEHSGFAQIHRLLSSYSSRPVPVQKTTCCMTHCHHVKPSRNDVAINCDYILYLYCYIPSIYSDIHAMCTGKHEEFYWLCKPWSISTKQNACLCWVVNKASCL